MKLLSDLNSLLSELQTWTDSPNRDHQVAALKSFANRAKEIITGEPTGDTRLITVELPKSDHGTRKLICQAINQTLEARGLAYQTTGTRFTITGEASPAPAGQTGIAEAVKAWDSGNGPDYVNVRMDDGCFLVRWGNGMYGFQGTVKDHSTPEAAIREQLAAGVKVWSGDREVVDEAAVMWAEHDRTPKTGLPVVPLGPNKNRLGEEVTVLKNDMCGKYPILAVQRDSNGKRDLVIKRRADGTSPYHRNGDLVGHLPPEPPKPREVWADLDDRGCFLGTQTTPKDGYVHFREVLPAAGKQYHVWIDSMGDRFMDAPSFTEEEAAKMGYRKATLVEVTTP